MKRIDNETLYEAIGGIGEDLLQRSEDQSFAGRAGEVRMEERRQQEAEQAKKSEKITPLPGAKKRAMVSLVLGLAAIVFLGIAARVIMRGNTLMSGGSAAPKQSLQETEAVSVAEKGESVTADAAPEEAGAEAAAEAAAPEAAAQGAEEETFAADGGAKSTSASAQAPPEIPLMTESAAPEETVQNAAAAAEEESATDEVPGPRRQYREARLPLGDMPLFFTFEGRRYDLIASDVPAERIRRGEEAAYIERYIDETTAEEDYLQEKAGTLSGMAYEVEGYDKEGLLCMETEEGTFLLFVSEDYASVPRYTEW
ncbi:MAG: hypothetical protein IJP92_02095 [Lachnospiraceae bacterium]|nr:hypothetical protein [Lachnospiraceae bacterium]